MNASSVTARVLSLAVLLLSLAPLGSMYVLFFSIGLGTGGGHYNFSNITSTDADGGPSYEDSLASVLKNPNATLEDLWTAIFDSQMVYPQNLQAKAVLALLQNQNDVFWLPVSAQSMHHLRILMPWILSFTLGVAIPCFLSIFALLRRQRRTTGRRYYTAHRRERNPAQKKKILHQLSKSLAAYTKILTDSDRVVVADEHKEMMQWRLPKSGVGSNIVFDELSTLSDDSHSPSESLCGVVCDSPIRLVNGLCSICLETFVETQSVSWSSNPQCMHCFHETCISSWLVRTPRAGSRDAKYPCPCCRRPFLLSIQPNQ